MELNEKHLSLLNSVKSFSKTKRYYGMMPRWVVKTCNDNDVRFVFQNGLVAYTSYKPFADMEMQGVVLTDKGLQCLSGN